MKLNKPNKQDERRGEDFFLPHLNLRLLLCQGITLGRVYNFEAGNLFSLFTCPTTWWGRSWPLSQEYMAFCCATFGLKRGICCCGASLWEGALDMCMGLVLRQGVVEGLQGSLGPAAQQSFAGAAALSSPGDSLSCPAFQLLHTGVQGVTCSLKVAQAKHKTQILTIALTEHEKSLLKCVWGGVVRGFFKAQMH